MNLYNGCENRMLSFSIILMRSVCFILEKTLALKNVINDCIEYCNFCYFEDQGIILSALYMSCNLLTLLFLIICLSFIMVQEMK